LAAGMTSKRKHHATATIADASERKRLRERRTISCESVNAGRRKRVQDGCRKNLWREAIRREPERMMAAAVPGSKAVQRALRAECI
jgi:hypothetical protein